MGCVTETVKCAVNYDFQRSSTVRQYLKRSINDRKSGGFIQYYLIWKTIGAICACLGSWGYNRGGVIITPR